MAVSEKTVIPLQCITREATAGDNATQIAGQDNE